MIFRPFYAINEFLSANRWTLVFGVVLGCILTVVLFYVLPVVSMQGQIISRTDDSVVIHVWGKKLRGTCKFLGISGYTLKNGLMTDTIATRVDMKEDGTTRPEGVFDIVKWLIFPTNNAEKAVMYVMHSCGPGDMRVTKIADVSLE